MVRSVSTGRRSRRGSRPTILIEGILLATGSLEAPRLAPLGSPSWGDSTSARPFAAVPRPIVDLDPDGQLATDGKGRPLDGRLGAQSPPGLAALGAAQLKIDGGAGADHAHQVHRLQPLGLHQLVVA